MLKLLAANSLLCVPFRFSAYDPLASSWLGGGAPKSHGLKVNNISHEFLLTINFLDDERQLSVFVAREYDRILSDEGVLRSCTENDSAVISDLSQPCKEVSTTIGSRFQLRSLAFETPIRDGSLEDQDSVWNHHKIGGTPFIAHDRFIAEAGKAFSSGFIHLLQMAFPNRDDGPLSGTWPFGEDLLHLFVHPHTLKLSYLICR